MSTQSNSYEQERVNALLDTDILDSPAEQAYDDITRLASFICQTPIAYISFITNDRQWFKSRIGIPFSETSFDDALCLPVLHETSLLHVPDMQNDARFKDKDFVTSDIGLRFYAGFPLITSSGHAIGTLCVLDYEAKKLSDEQQFALEALGRQVVHQLELRTILMQKERDQQQLAILHERTATILDSIGSTFFSIDSDGNFIYINSIAEKRLGSTGKTLIGKNLWKEFPTVFASELYPVTQQVQKTQQKVNYEQYYQASDTWFEMQVSPAADNGISIYAQDITERKKGEAHILYQALHDTLTGLPNRSLLADQLMQACKQAKREKHMCAVLFLDIDNFKDINDSLGHNAGDILLKEVSQRFKSSLREEDIIVRFGGDEFVIIAHRLKEVQDVHAIIEAIYKSLETPIRIADSDINVHSSIGVSMYPLDGKDGETLLKNADIALYEAKRQGRKTHQFFWDIKKSPSKN